MGSSDRRQTVTTSRTPLPGTQGLINQIATNASTLPSQAITLDPSTAAGLGGLEGVAALPGVAGGAAALDQFLSPGGGLETSLDTLQGTAAGDLVTTNPALIEALAANRDAREASLIGRFAAAGRSGLNPGVAEAITRANAQAELPVIAQDISTQQARQQEAAKFLPGLFGTLGQAATFGPGLEIQAGQTREAFDRANAEAELRRALAAMQGQGTAVQLMTPFATTTQETVTPRPSTGSQLLGGALLLGGSFLGGPGGASLAKGVGGMFGGSGAGGGSSSPFPVDAAGRLLGGI